MNTNRLQGILNSLPTETRKGFTESDIKNAFAAGAKITIDKACMCFNNFLNARVDNHNYQLRREDFEQWVNDFRKELEQ